MSIPVLEDILVAVANETWAETFEFYSVNEFTPDTLAADSEWEIALRKRESGATVTRLRSDDEPARAVRTGHIVAARWPLPNGDTTGASRVGLYDFQIREFLASGDVDTRLMGVIEFRAGL